MPHRTRFSSLVRFLALAALAAPWSTTSAALVSSGPVVAAEPPTVDPDATNRELICRMLKVLGKPCPKSDFLTYEDYYAEVELAWNTCDPNGFDPERRQELLAATLDVRDSQTPAPAGVDPVAYQNFMLVLDEIIYEMGG